MGLLTIAEGPHAPHELDGAEVESRLSRLQLVFQGQLHDADDAPVDQESVGAVRYAASASLGLNISRASRRWSSF